jgi:hypothetical protein
MMEPPAEQHCASQFGSLAKEQVRTPGFAVGAGVGVGVAWTTGVGVAEGPDGVVVFKPSPQLTINTARANVAPIDVILTIGWPLIG